MDENIEVTINGVRYSLDTVPPEFKAQVEKSLAAARAAAGKAGANNAKMRINIVQKHVGPPPSLNLPFPDPDSAGPALESGPSGPATSDKLRLFLFIAGVIGLLIFAASQMGLLR